MPVFDMLKRYGQFIKAATLLGARAGSIAGAGYSALTYRSAFQYDAKVPENEQEMLGETLVELGSRVYNICDGALEGAKTGAAVGFGASAAPVLMPMTFLFIQHIQRDAVNQIRAEQAKLREEDSNPHTKPASASK